jgi:hypothetical protein
MIFSNKKTGFFHGYGAAKAPPIRRKQICVCHVEIENYGVNTTKISCFFTFLWLFNDQKGISGG